MSRQCQDGDLALTESQRGAEGDSVEGLEWSFSSAGRADKEYTHWISYLRCQWSRVFPLLAQYQDFPFIRQKNRKARKRAKETETGTQRDREAWP